MTEHYCEKCGFSIPKDNFFCPGYGAKQPSPIDLRVEGVSPPLSHRNKIFIIGSIVIAFIIVGAILPGVLPSNNDSSKSHRSKSCITEFTIEPKEVAVGEPFYVTCRITNIGELDDSYQLVVKRYGVIPQYGEILNVLNITVKAGENNLYSWSFTSNKPGMLRVSIDDKLRGLDVVLKIDAYELRREYDENEVAADLKYKDKIIYVEGMIDRIGKDIMGKPYIVLDDGGFWGIQCVFEKKYELDIATLVKGQWVTVRGECRGKVLSTNILLKDCTLID